jgi:hypothetical protein
MFALAFVLIENNAAEEAGAFEEKKRLVEHIYQPLGVLPAV